VGKIELMYLMGMVYYIKNIVFSREGDVISKDEVVKMLEIIERKMEELYEVKEEDYDSIV
jgi:ribonuclease PH